MALAISLLSGGLDSSVATAVAISEGYEVIALSFNYGQRHVRELEAARRIANLLNAREHFEVKLSLDAWGGSALTDVSIAVPTSGTSPNVIPTTYVPARNTIFLSVALSIAEARQAETIFLGINEVDYSGYPDCREAYLEAFQHLADLATKAGVEGRGVRLRAPLLHLSKVEIVRLGLSLGVPILETYSCYQGGDPCGLCDACRIRDSAFLEAGLPTFRRVV